MSRRWNANVTDQRRRRPHQLHLHVAQQFDARATDDAFMTAAALSAAIAAQWDNEIVPQLTTYIRIPAKSPPFDPEWKKNGHIERVVALAEAWVRKQPVRGLEVEIVRLKGRTPLLYFNVPATAKKSGRDATVLLYGHLDKQPEMIGWHDGYGPWSPRFDDGKLYGRGGAPDGYSGCGSLPPLPAWRARGVAHTPSAG